MMDDDHAPQEKEMRADHLKQYLPCRGFIYDSVEFNISKLPMETLGPA